MAMKVGRFQPFLASRARWAAAGACLLLMVAIGCGMVAAPQPPSLKLPEPVTNLTAQRVGDKVNLHWTMPKRATDNVLLEGGQTADICRRESAGPCVKVGRLVLAPEVSAVFTDTLPGPLLSGPPRPLTYIVELENHAGRTAGPSNQALTAAGAAPAGIVNLQARAQANGIVLSWTPAGGQETVRIHRRLDQKTAAGKGTTPAEQMLEFTGQDQGRVLDTDAALDHIYTYWVQRVAKVSVAGHSVELAGAPSEPVTINARDVFPPAVPQGLQAVADPEAHSIDLSWQPDSEADLAGYRVYRREAGDTAAPVRISGKTEPAAAFRDTKAVPEHRYEYSVSAVDRDGNESARTAEVEESLPKESSE